LNILVVAMGGGKVKISRKVQKGIMLGKSFGGKDRRGSVGEKNVPTRAKPT